MDVYESLKIIDFEDCGNNGVVFKALENKQARALKVFYGFSDIEIMIEKSLREFEINKILGELQGIPKTHKFYGSFDEKNECFEEFRCDGFDLEKAKEYVISKRMICETDNFEEIKFAGAFTMEYMDTLSKLPKETTELNYKLPKKFFKKLRVIGNKMLKKGYSLPREDDFCFDKNLEPIVLDFGCCESVDSLVNAGMSKRGAIKHIRVSNDFKIRRLEDQYQNSY